MLPRHSRASPLFYASCVGPSASSRSSSVVFRGELLCIERESLCGNATFVVARKKVRKVHRRGRRKEPAIEASPKCLRRDLQ